MPDRNFDDIADHFEKRIYGGSKGRLRQAVIQRDLDQYLPESFHQSPKRILDLGGGMGHFAISYAMKGHEVIYNDLSGKMLNKAKMLAEESSLSDKIKWLHSPYQYLTPDKYGKFDLIFCHALIEWLDQPEMLISHLRKLTDDDGFLSLCFYNPAGMVYRNLIKGNFNYLQTDKLEPDQGSLTPHNPQRYETVFQWLVENQFEQLCLSGIRVFSDYVVEKRGGLADPDAVFNMEMTYSTQAPFCLLGRYLHTLQRANILSLQTGL